ncbi:unnamed protein product [Caenorhabditis auriculariae]|uniref:Uncharacterized protein n=1 Tax=Caenorhabditis auriculariae TaxID=2777116 RepID=A0A8S1H0Y8_9PELO|nr:unnamed protein product [Caenorhabditis auriculariae]
MNPARGRANDGRPGNEQPDLIPEEPRNYRENGSGYRRYRDRNVRHDRPRPEDGEVETVRDLIRLWRQFEAEQRQRERQRERRERLFGSYIADIVVSELLSRDPNINQRFAQQRQQINQENRRNVEHAERPAALEAEHPVGNAAAPLGPHENREGEENPGDDTEEEQEPGGGEEGQADEADVQPPI